ncbi:hypothetical protein HPP92_001615 [Vanilla planifolia]|uniref:Uncharacterized protein n=1 Tax=Vanilla planifolia TaxID=51239 RepID=A0A835RS00_VANPL|nr:hypothetical protein HPP92_001615 [Vanilla planifolia]
MRLFAIRIQHKVHLRLKKTLMDPMLAVGRGIQMLLGMLGHFRASSKGYEHIVMIGWEDGLEDREEDDASWKNCMDDMDRKGGIMIWEFNYLQSLF